MLADAGFRHELAVTLAASDGTVRSVEVRPLVPVGYAGSPTGASATNSRGALPDTLFARAVATSIDDATAIPALLHGRGAPYPGQAELSDVDVLSAAGTNLDPKGRAALAAQMAASGSTKPEEEKTFFQKYWMIIVGVGVFFVVQGFGGGGGGGSG